MLFSQDQNKLLFFFFFKSDGFAEANSFKVEDGW